jgi:hypothetical protein
VPVHCDALAMTLPYLVGSNETWIKGHVNCFQKADTDNNDLIRLRAMY